MAGRTHGGRRRLLAAGAVVLAVILLAGVPALITMRPAFFGRFDGLAEKYEPWSTSTHVEATCQDCHASPGVLSRTVFQTKMVGEFYVSLVSRSRVPGGFGAPTNAACQSCHDDLRSVSPKGDLRIPHRAHVTILKMRCTECHNFLVHEKSPEGKLAPSMSGCLRCHNGDVAKDNCTACHTEKSAPDSHRAADWSRTHAAAADDPECDSCHKWTENWCVDCHTKRPESHSANWRKLHGSAVKARRSCEACHEGPFCERCHGEVPQLNFDPALKLVR